MSTNTPLVEKEAGFAGEVHGLGLHRTCSSHPSAPWDASCASFHAYVYSMFSYKLSPKEMEAVLNLDAFERYQYALKRFADSEQIWALVDSEGYIALSSATEEIYALAFWPMPEYASLCIAGAWEGYTPKLLTLDEFREEVEPILVNNNALISIFPKAGTGGFIVTLEEFWRDMNEELSWYE